MFERNTDRLIIIPLNISCQSHEGHKLVKYLKDNLPVVLQRRAESISCKTLQPDADESHANVYVEFLLGLMESPRVIYGLSHLLYLAIKKFEKTVITLDGKKISSDITDEGLKKLIKTIYEQLRKEKN